MKIPVQLISEIAPWYSTRGDTETRVFYGAS
jgi:hypothetical protein